MKAGEHVVQVLKARAHRRAASSLCSCKCSSLVHAPLSESLSVCKFGKGRRRGLLQKSFFGFFERFVDIRCLVVARVARQQTRRASDKAAQRYIFFEPVLRSVAHLRLRARRYLPTQPSMLCRPCARASPRRLALRGHSQYRPGFAFLYTRRALRDK